MFLHLQNAIHLTLYIIRRAFISLLSKKTIYTKISSVHGSSVLTVNYGNSELQYYGWADNIIVKQQRNQWECYLYSHVIFLSICPSNGNAT